MQYAQAPAYPPQGINTYNNNNNNLQQQQPMMMNNNNNGFQQQAPPPPPNNPPSATKPSFDLDELLGIVSSPAPQQQNQNQNQNQQGQWNQQQQQQQPNQPYNNNNNNFNNNNNNNFQAPPVPPQQQGSPQMMNQQQPQQGGGGFSNANNNNFYNNNSANNNNNNNSASSPSLVPPPPQPPTAPVYQQQQQQQQQQQALDVFGLTGSASANNNNNNNNVQNPNFYNNNPYAPIATNNQGSPAVMQMPTPPQPPVNYLINNNSNNTFQPQNNQLLLPNQQQPIIYQAGIVQGPSPVILQNQGPSFQQQGVPVNAFQGNNNNNNPYLMNQARVGEVPQLQGQIHQGSIVNNGNFQQQPTQGQLQLQQQQQQPSQEELDRRQLEQIRRLRMELEKEEHAETEKLEQLNTWACSQCTFRNKSSATKCDVCDAARPGYSSTSNSSNNNNNNNSTVPRPPPPPPPPVSRQQEQQQQQQADEHWKCPVCTLENKLRDEKCQACGQTRPEAITQQLQFFEQRRNGGGGSGSSVVGNPNPATRTVTFNMNNNTVHNPPLPGMWSCSRCTYENPPNLQVCAMCQNTKSGGSGTTTATSALSFDDGSLHSLVRNIDTSDPVFPPIFSNQPNIQQQLELRWAGSTVRERTELLKQLSETLNKRGVSGSPSTSTATRGGGGGSAGYPAGGYAGARGHTGNLGAPTTTTPALGGRGGSGGNAEVDSDDDVMWQKDQDAKECNNCHSGFGLLTRRHHCRFCGFVFCHNCSQYKVKRGNGEEARSCYNCYNARK